MNNFGYNINKFTQELAKHAPKELKKGQDLFDYYTQFTPLKLYTYIEQCNESIYKLKNEHEKLSYDIEKLKEITKSKPIPDVDNITYVERLKFMFNKINDFCVNRWKHQNLYYFLTSKTWKEYNSKNLCFKFEFPDYMLFFQLLKNFKIVKDDPIFSYLAVVLHTINSNKELQETSVSISEIKNGSSFKMTIYSLDKTDSISCQFSNKKDTINPYIIWDSIPWTRKISRAIELLYERENEWDNDTIEALKKLKILEYMKYSRNLTRIEEILNLYKHSNYSYEWNDYIDKFLSEEKGYLLFWEPYTYKPRRKKITEDDINRLGFTVKDVVIALSILNAKENLEEIGLSLEDIAITKNIVNYNI